MPKLILVLSLIATLAFGIIASAHAQPCNVPCIDNRGFDRQMQQLREQNWQAQQQLAQQRNQQQIDRLIQEQQRTNQLLSRP